MVVNSYYMENLTYNLKREDHLLREVLTLLLCELQDSYKSKEAPSRDAVRDILFVRRFVNSAIGNYQKPRKFSIPISQGGVRARIRKSVKLKVKKILEGFSEIPQPFTGMFTINCDDGRIKAVALQW